MLSWDLYFYVFVSLGNQTQGSCMIGNQSTIELHPSLKESLSLSPLIPISFPGYRLYIP